MANTLYPQSDSPHPRTMTVNELAEKLAAMDQDAIVVFRSPFNGAFGPRTMYTVDKVSEVSMEAYDHNYGPQSYYDEDTGEETQDEEDYIQHFNAWKGVVIE